jgi:hypothetical protein
MPTIHRRLDFPRGAVVPDADGRLTDSFDRQQRAAHILGHQICEIHRAPASRQLQCNIGMA